ncbi:sulfate permease, SulP family [Lutibacter oricola]|uniref:Sulfate permease, SulP family n=1 Tax=Lutibacter oricola TaxID=762486 RepID=A0A1H3EIB9_9FLAO|nr:solute carrier family 26 protein [Lutibacter oricola]SDX78337.1 sulfate permease, SulP family [Lutibacter oricola]
MIKLKNILPILEWLPNYKREWLKGDLSAGITVGIMLIPQGIAYAMIAGLPPIYGLYTAMIPQIVYALFGTSRQLAVGPVAMDSLIVASSVVALAEIGTENFIEFAILLAFLMGTIQMLLGILKFGFLVNFLSRPVISGFTSAAAIIIGLNQLKHLLGVDIERNNKIQYLLLDAFEKIKNTDWITTLIGLSAILILVLFKKYFKKIPAALVVVVLGILVVKFFNLETLGVKIIGEIPEGLPSFKMPVFSLEIIKELVPVAFTLALIAFLEAISVAKAIELTQTDYKVNPNKELIAIGLGNLVGAFFQTYPATGGLSRTAVNNDVGAKTPLASIVSAIVVAITLLFLTPLFYYLPKAILAAIIMVAVSGLLDFEVPKQLLKYSIREFMVLIITLLVTITIGIKEGVMVGVILSVGILIYRSANPHIAILGKVPNTHFYRNVSRFEGLLETQDDILVIRFDAQLFFANVQFFKDSLAEYVAKKGTSLKLIVIDGESINRIDSTAVYMLKEIISTYETKNIDIAFAGMKGPVRDILSKAGIYKMIGFEKCFMNVHQAVDLHNKNKVNLDIERKYFDYVKQTNN